MNILTLAHLSLMLAVIFGLFYIILGREFPSSLKNRSVFAGALVLIILDLITISKPLLDGRIFDDHSVAYLQILNMVPAEKAAWAGEDVKVRFNVRKRPGCNGRVLMRMRGDKRDIVLRELSTNWPVGESIQTATYKIPTDTAPGEYRLYFTTRVKCKKTDEYRATSPGTRLSYTSPNVRVTVLPKN